MDRKPHKKIDHIRFSLPGGNVAAGLEGGTGVIPCQINTKNGRPLWIFLKFGETNAYTEKLGHTKFLPHP